MHLIIHERIINGAYAMFVSDCLYKSTYNGCSFELPQLVQEIQMSAHKICFYKVDTNTWAVI